jgi:hypothetical protein
MCKRINLISRKCYADALTTEQLATSTFKAKAQKYELWLMTATRKIPQATYPEHENVGDHHTISLMKMPSPFHYKVSLPPDKCNPTKKPA